MRALLTVAAATLLLAACSPMRWAWEHAGNLGPEGFRQDSRTCQAISAEEASYYGDYIYPYHPWPYHDHFGHRHHDPFGHGYGWYPDRYGYYQYRDDLFRVCMRVKGWRQVPLSEPPEDAPGYFGEDRES